MPAKEEEEREKEEDMREMTEPRGGA